MSAISESLSLINTIKEPLSDYAPVVMTTIAKEALRKQIVNFVGSMYGGPAFFIVSSTLPLASTKVMQLMGYITLGDDTAHEISGDYLSRFTATFEGTRADILKTFMFLLSASPKDLISGQSSNVVKAVSLDYACRQISNYAGSYIGSVIYAVASPGIAEKAPPFTLTIFRGVCQVTGYVGDTLWQNDESSEEPMAIELDDFKAKAKAKDLATEDEWIVVTEEVESESWS